MEQKSTLSSHQISAVCKQLHDRIPELLDHFGIEYIKYNDRFAFACPVHGGDNPEGCTIFIDGKENWVCWTHNCQETYKRSLLGLITGILSKRNKRNVSITEVVNFCINFLNCDLKEADKLKPNHMSKYLRFLEIFNAEPIIEFTASREEFLQIVTIPSKYYLNRKYQEETLIRYDIGDCFIEHNNMYRRAVVPYYNTNMDLLGYSGRSIRDIDMPKWLNNPGLKKSQTLYGLHIAKNEILKTRTAILVEGAGDVWRSYEAGFENTIAISGANLSDAQLIELERSGCTNLIILTDNDKAGEKAASQIIKKCGRRFNYKRPEIPKFYKDIGDMDTEILKSLLENIHG